jgi:hypothetical protein
MTFVNLITPKARVKLKLLFSKLGSWTNTPAYNSAATMKEEKEVRKTDTCAKFLTKEAHRSTTVFGHMLMLMMPMWSS